VTDDAAPRASPRIVPCKEYEPVEIPLEEVLTSSGRLDLNPEIQSRDYFSVSLKAGVLTLRAGGVIGYIPLNERVVVRVIPRVPIKDLSRIVHLSGEPPTVLSSVRKYATSEVWSDSLLDLYATALVDSVEGILHQGLLRDYVRREAVSSFPHGRVQMHRTVQTLIARGIHHQAHVSWFERTVDTAPNRALKLALWVMAQRYINLGTKTRDQRKLHRRIGALFGALDGVELDPGRRFLEDGRITGARPLAPSRSYYVDAMAIAQAVIEQQSIVIEDPDGPVRLPSLVLNMEKVFEAFLRNVLATYALDEGWDHVVLDGNGAEAKVGLYTGLADPAATPDIVIKAPDGSVPVILEIKNVPVTNFSGRDATNQAVTYAVRYGAKRTVLVHPRKSKHQDAGMRHVGDIADVSVYQYRFDLGAEDLNAEIDAFGSEVRRLWQLNG